MTKLIFLTFAAWPNPKVLLLPQQIAQMRTFIYLLLVSFFHLSGANIAAVEQGTSDPKLDESQLVAGLKANDIKSFEAAARLPTERAFSLLYPYVLDPKCKENAVRSIRSIPGFTAFMKNRISEKRKTILGSEDLIEFSQLGQIGGQESAAAVAPFLFVKDPVRFNGHMTTSSIMADALWSLGQMNLPDAPPSGRVEDWRSWAENHGYRDPAIPTLITLEQKGLTAKEVELSDKLWREAAVKAPSESAPDLNTPSPKQPPCKHTSLPPTADQAP